MAAQANEIAQYALRLGDDAMVLGQRLCEWVAAAPTLEEDLALANVALDYLGRARMLYGYAGPILGQTEDEFAFLRDVPEFRNALITELPRGDFAFSMVRQWLLDEFEVAFFEALVHSSDATLAAIAGKTIKEARYHQRRSREWLRRLGLGTPESNRRAQAALDALWGYVAELFEADALEQSLVATGIAVDRAPLEAPWRAVVGDLLADAELRMPAAEWTVRGGREGIHTEHLGHLLSDMQFLQRAYPGAQW